MPLLGARRCVSNALGLTAGVEPRGLGYVQRTIYLGDEWYGAREQDDDQAEGEEGESQRAGKVFFEGWGCQRAAGSGVKRDSGGLTASMGRVLAQKRGNRRGPDDEREGLDAHPGQVAKAVCRDGLGAGSQSGLPRYQRGIGGFTYIHC